MPSSDPVGHSESVADEVVPPIRSSAAGARVTRIPRRRSPRAVLFVAAVVVAVMVVAAVLFIGVPRSSSTGPGS